MSLNEEAITQCPYCMSRIEIAVDCSLNSQEYVEDCSVCCRPILLNISIDEAGEVAIDARPENE